VLILVRSAHAAERDHRLGEIIIDTSDGRISVKVLAHDKSRVRLGVTAPPSCKVLRAELDEEIEGVPA
jgi:carbon storage regulator CsrA